MATQKNNITNQERNIIEQEIISSLSSNLFNMNSKAMTDGYQYGLEKNELNLTR